MSVGISGGKDFGKVSLGMSTGTMPWGQFGSICARGKHTFLLLRNPILRIYWRDVLAHVGNEVHGRL